MNKRLVSVLVFALVVSAIASFVLYRLIAIKFAASAKATPAQVTVASHDLEVGTLIKEDDLKQVDWGGPQPKGAVLNSSDLIGRGVVETIYQDEPVLDNRLASKGAGAGLAAIIPVGMRAVAVRVNDVAGVAGFVVPGMRVDILIAGNPPGVGATLGTQSKTLLQNIEVLSAGQNIQKDAAGKPVSVAVVNLLVSPEQAERLSLANSETRIQLILRNPLDTETVKTPGTAMALLFSGSKGLPEPSNAGPRIRVVPVSRRVSAAPAPPVKIVVPVTVEVFKGSARSEMTVQPEEDKKW